MLRLKYLCTRSRIDKVSDCLDMDVFFSEPNSREQTAYLVVNPVMVDIYDFLFNCTAAVRPSYEGNDGLNRKL